MPRRFSLLVADDDAESRDTMAQVLERDGYRVLTARCGKEAIDLAQEESLNGLILEMHLPDLTGLETLQRLDDRPKSQRLPSILVSAEPWKELQLEALDIGVFAFIQKPVREEILRGSVARLLDRSGGEDALRLAIQVYRSQSIEIARNEMTREEIHLDRKKVRKDKEKSNDDKDKD